MVTKLRLSPANQFALMKMIEAEYTSSNLTDAGFAGKATETLGTRVTMHHVNSARNALKIPSNHCKRGGKKNILEQRVLQLEADVQEMQHTLEVLAKHRIPMPVKG